MRPFLISKMLPMQIRNIAQAYLYLGRAYISQSRGGRPSNRCAPRSGCRRDEAQQEIMDLIRRCDVRRGAQRFQPG